MSASSVSRNSNSNTFSVLSTVTPTVPRGTISSNPTVNLGSTPLSTARLTGLVSSGTPVVPTSIPLVVTQTINTPPTPRGNIYSSAPPSPGIGYKQPTPRFTPTTPSSLSASTLIPLTRQSIPGGPVPGIGLRGPSSPTARSALLNLNTSNGSNVNLGLPTIKVAPQNSGLPSKPTAQLMEGSEFEVKNYQGIIENSSLENELLNAGYAPSSKIIVRTDNGEKRTQYIKAINKKGQSVFILVDVTGYTTARSSDLTLIESHSASVVPYSVKTGAYTCAGKDVCGVAFECGSDAVCVLARGTQDLSPKEANFVLVEPHALSSAVIETDGSIMAYPVIRLSEIRANPDLVLSNTDLVTRRLRNSSYIAELQELANAQQSIQQLIAAFVKFNGMREVSAVSLNTTLTQLEAWNNEYIKCPPQTDDAKDKYRKLQYNLAFRNEGIATLLRSMKKVSDFGKQIDDISKEINEITNYCENEFKNLNFSVSD